MIRRLILVLALSVVSSGAGAQNVTCATRPFGDSSNACASTAFVQTAISGLGANPTAQVGLTAVNGVATTYMRSDAAPPLSQAISPNMTGNWTFSPAAGDALTINTAAGSVAKGFSITQSAAGSPTGVAALNQIKITGDNADCTGADALTCFGLYIEHQTGGASTKSSRSTIFVHQIVGADAATSGSNRDYVGITSHVDSNAAMPVTGTSATLFAFSGLVASEVGSSGLNAIVGAEIDIRANVSLPYVIGWNLVMQGNQQASTRSVAYQVSATSGAAGFMYGIGFTTDSGGAPIASSGTVLAAVNAISAANGIDLTNFTFSGDAFKTTGWRVDGAGETTTAQSVNIIGATNEGFYVSNGTASGAFASSALFTNSIIAGTSSAHAFGFITNNSLRGSISSAGAWTIGNPGSLGGSLTIASATSGTGIAMTAPATASAAIAWGTASGTPAVTASSPLAINTTTGNITCATCVTSSGGGAISGTAPIAVSAAGVVSITGAAGQVLAGATPAFTATPTLGTAGSVNGTLTINGNTATAILTATSNISNTSISGYYNGGTLFFKTLDVTDNNTVAYDFRGFHGNSFAAIVAQITDQTSGAVKGKLAFGVANSSGAASNFVYIHPSGGLNVGTDTDAGAGNINATTGFKVGGTSGQSVTITVRDSAGTGSCTIIFTGGIKTGGTCI